MSDYATAVADLLRQRRDVGVADVPLNLLILGRAVEALLPGQLEARNGNFYVGSARISSTADLYGTAAIPGCYFRQLTMTGDQTGLVDVNNPPAALLSNFVIGEIGSLVGGNNLDFLSALSDAWTKEIAPAGLLDAAQVKNATALLSLGIIVTPETQERLLGKFPRLAVGLSEIANASVGGRRAAWYSLAEKLRPALAAYDRKNVAEAAAAVRAAELKVAAIDAVYSTVEAIRDLPANAAGSLLDGIKSVFLRGPIVTLLLIVGGAAALWYFWPTLARKFAQGSEP